MRGATQPMDEDQKADPSVDVSQWLKEVGRRRWPCPQARESAAVVASAPRRTDRPLRRTLLLALLLVASLQYLYASTTVEILSLPSLLVFVFTG